MKIRVSRTTFVGCGKQWVSFWRKKIARCLLGLKNLKFLNLDYGKLAEGNFNLSLVWKIEKLSRTYGPGVEHWLKRELG
jgi:hypothetical protein